MSGKVLNEKEIEMIKEYQLNKNEDIPLYFYKKFSNDLANIIYSKINSKFASIPIERNDLLHLIWKGIKMELEEFDDGKGYTLFAGFARKGYEISIKEALRFLSNGHILLNTASSLEEVNEISIGLKSKNGVVYQELKYQELTREVIDQITPYFSKNSQRRVQKIIYLRSCGYSLSEISKKIRIPVREVRNIYNSIKIIGELLYKIK